MIKYFVGIVSGSTMCKTILFEGKSIVDYQNVKTGWNPGITAYKRSEYYSFLDKMESRYFL